VEKKSLRSDGSRRKKEKQEKQRVLRIRKRSYKELMVDALVPNADEGRGTLRKASGSRVQALIRGYPNGETRHSEPMASPD
jgi:hypothetical protein